MPPSAPSHLRRLAGWLVWCVYLTVTVSVCLEIGVRLFMPQVLPVDAPEIFSPDSAVGWRHNPNVRALANTGERDVMICTDRFGDRVSCDVPARTDCRQRILVVGDSFVEAMAVPYEQTVWAKIEQDTGACVDATGVSGYEPSQYLYVARERLRRGERRYDLVLATMFAGNDYVVDGERIPPPQSVWEQPVRLLPQGLDAESLHQWLYPFDQWLESRSHAYVALRFAVRNVRDPGDVGMYGLPIAVVRSRLTPEILAATSRSFELMAAEAEHAGVPFMITILPVPLQALDPTGETLRTAFPALAAEIDMNLTETMFIPRLQHLRGVTAIVDTLPDLRAHPTPELWGTRDTHLSPSGHEAWFASLRAPVRSALGLPPN